MEEKKSKKRKGLFITIACVGVPIITGAAICVIKPEWAKDLWTSIKTGSKYSRRWMSKLTDEELNNEREIVRLEYCAPGNDEYKAHELWNLLRIFDDEIRSRACGGVEPAGPNINREHGWYLPNDD